MAAGLNIQDDPEEFRRARFAFVRRRTIAG
jgi:hypothetical protein